jgi:hypothetical protein
MATATESANSLLKLLIEKYGSRNEALCSHEYHALYLQNSQAIARETASNRRRILALGTAAMNAAGQKIGDRVELTSASPWGLIESIVGTIVIRSGKLVVDCGSVAAGAGKRYRAWHRGWKKAVFRDAHPAE